MPSSFFQYIQNSSASWVTFLVNNLLCCFLFYILIVMVVVFARKFCWFYSNIMDETGWYIDLLKSEGAILCNLASRVIELICHDLQWLSSSLLTFHTTRQAVVKSIKYLKFSISNFWVLSCDFRLHCADL